MVKEIAVVGTFLVTVSLTNTSHSADDVMLMAVRYVVAGRVDAPFVAIIDRKNCIFREHTHDGNWVSPVTYYFNNVAVQAIRYRINDAGHWELNLTGDGKPVADVGGHKLMPTIPPMTGPRRQHAIVVKGDLDRTKKAIKILFEKYCKGTGAREPLNLPF